MANVHDSNKLILAVCALALLTALTGCSGGLSDTPSDSMAKEVVESKNAEAIKAGQLQIESFEKTNGLKRVEAGVEQYVLEYKAVLLYPKGFMPECIDESRFNVTCFQTRLSYGIRPSPFKEAGARETVSGKILFEKAERGWRATEYSSSVVTGELTEQSGSRRDRRHAKNTDQAAAAEQKPAQGDATPPQTNTDGQTGFLATLDRWLEPLAYRAVSFSKRGDGLWLKDGGNEKQIVKAAPTDAFEIFEITDGGQVLYRLGDKSYLLPRADASPRPINLDMRGAVLSRDGHWAAVSDFEKGSHLVDMNDGTLLPLPKQPLPDRSKAFMEKGMDMEAVQQQLTDPENNRIRDSGFVWSADGDHLAFLRCAGVCALAIYDVKTRLVTLLPSANGMYPLVDIDTDSVRSQLYPVLFYANKLIVSEYRLLREHELNTGHATTLAKGVFAPSADRDGKKIAYVNSKRQRSVFIRDVSSGEVKKLTSFVATKDDVESVGLSWSPDNRTLFYGIYYEDGTDGGWMMDMEAKVHRRIPLDADKLDAKTMEVFNPFYAETFTKNIRIPRFDFISASGVRNAVIGFMALVAALLVYVFIRLVRNVTSRAPGIKRMAVVANANTQQATAVESIFCSECGAQCAAHGAFCPKCGARL